MLCWSRSSRWPAQPVEPEFASGGSVLVQDVGDSCLKTKATPSAAFKVVVGAPQVDQDVGDTDLSESQHGGHLASRV